jgi:hypothetical protein
VNADDDDDEDEDDGSFRFLPPLNVGFTRGDDSVSDFDEHEGEAADGTKKKNPRGQRARKG